MIKILGIDPGLDNTGWAVLEKGGPGAAARLLACGLIHTSKSLALEKRLAAIYDCLVSVISANTPCFAAIEEVFFSKRADTQANTTHARGVILLACEKQSLPISAYNPREIKKTVSGNGAADKAQMRKIVQITLGLKEIPKSDDVADAMAAALCHLRLAPLRFALKNAGSAIAAKRLEIADLRLPNPPIREDLGPPGLT